jgi:hypothetical protein
MENELAKRNVVRLARRLSVFEMQKGERFSVRLSCLRFEFA